MQLFQAFEARFAKNGYARNALALLVLAGPACAAGAQIRRDGPDAPGPATATTTVVSSAQAAGLYRTHVPAPPTTDSFVGQLKSALDRFMKGQGRPALKRDARLDCVASDLARISAGKQVSSSAMVEFLRSHCGVVEPEPNLIGMGGDHGAEAAAIENLRDQLAGIPNASAWREVGIGVWRSGTTWSATLVLQEDNLTMDPLPRALPSGGQTGLGGRLESNYHSPEVVVTPPAGTVAHLPVVRHGASFKTRFECNSGDGVYQVEVNGEDRRGPTVLANFPIYCGVAPPTRFELPITPGLPTSQDPATVERQILDLMDRDRAKAGLPPLKRDARLADVARKYSREMADLGEIAHFSARTGTVLDRIRAAGVEPRPTVLAENVGRDYTADGIEHGFMSSPGHRDNILSRAVTHVGVGVALGKREGDAIPIFVTQVFAGRGE